MNEAVVPFLLPFFHPIKQSDEDSHEDQLLCLILTSEIHYEDSRVIDNIDAQCDCACDCG